MEAKGSTGMVSPLPQSTALPHDVFPEERELATTIRLSDIVSSDLRLEASAFNIEAREAVEELRSSGYPLIPLLGEDGLCQEAHNAFRFRRIYVDRDHGVPFLSSSDIIGIRPERDRYLSLKVARLDELKVRKWDVLISCSGTIGNVGLASETIAGRAVSQHVIRLKATNPETAGFITAFLRSRFGRLQLTQASYGSVVVHIEPEHLHRIVIPDIPPIRQAEIGRKVIDAYERRDEANRLLDEADRLLHERLGLPPLADLVAEEARAKVSHSSVRASQLDARFDGSYHAPAAIVATAELHRLPMETTTVDDPRLSLAVNAVTKFRKRVYVDRGGIPLLTSKQLFQLDPVGLKSLAKGAHTKDLAEIGLREGMVMVTCSGTVGRVAIVPDYMNGWTASQDAHRIIPVDLSAAGYLFAWLSSDYGKELVTRHTYGSVVVHIDREMLASVPVPLPDRATRDDISINVLQANELRDEAWRLEREAISSIERLISKE